MSKTKLKPVLYDPAADLAKLKLWAEDVKGASIQGAHCINAFLLAMWYGEEDGKSRLPKREFDENGDIADDRELLWFNFGVKWHVAWEAAEPLVQAALLKALGILISSALAGISAGGKK